MDGMESWVRNRASSVLIWVLFLFGLVCVEIVIPDGCSVVLKVGGLMALDISGWGEVPIIS